MFSTSPGLEVWTKMGVWNVLSNMLLERDSGGLITVTLPQTKQPRVSMWLPCLKRMAVVTLGKLVVLKN